MSELAFFLQIVNKLLTSSLPRKLKLIIVFAAKFKKVKASIHNLLRRTFFFLKLSPLPVRQATKASEPCRSRANFLEL